MAQGRRPSRVGRKQVLCLLPEKYELFALREAYPLMQDR